MSFPRYPKYKDSGVEWLGEVPEHWRIIPLHRLTDAERPIMYGIVLPGPDVEDGVPILKGGNVKPARMNLESMARTTSEIEAPYARARLRAGDLVYSIRGSIGDCERVPAQLEGSNITQDVARVAIGSNADPAWARWALLAPEVRSDLASGSLGAAVRGINIFDLKRACIPTPPEVEQTAIAAFLDRETAKIDALVAEQERLIELLKEKRQAVISHAVTKGLDAKVPMKDSGVEWLGEIPAHWELGPLKYAITRIEQGWSPQCESFPAEEGEWGVLKVGCGNGDVFDPSEQKALPPDVTPDPKYEVQIGDILMSRGNTQGLVGAATLVERASARLLLSDLLYRFRSRSDRALPQYLVLALRSPYGRFQLERVATGTSASMKKIAQGDIRDFLVALPPLQEQAAIVQWCERETCRLDALAAEAQRAIDLLQERRTALISAVVTGQIDVRDDSARPRTDRPSTSRPPRGSAIGAAGLD